MSDLTRLEQADLDIGLSIADHRWRGIGADLDHMLTEIVEAAALAGGLPDPICELSIVLADDATVRDLNRRYRGQDKATNVLSFAFDDGADPSPPGMGGPPAPHPLGDVIIAFEPTTREALEQGKPAPHHLYHLVIHGVLHLLGYDHLSDQEAERMEAIETRILAGFGIADPYADGPAAPDD